MLEQNFEMESWETFFNPYNIPKKKKKEEKKEKKKGQPEKKVPQLIPFFPPPTFPNSRFSSLISSC